MVRSAVAGAAGRKYSDDTVEAVRMPGCSRPSGGSIRLWAQKQPIRCEAAGFQGGTCEPSIIIECSGTVGSTSRDE